MKSTTGREVVGCLVMLALFSAGVAIAEWNKGLEAYRAKDWATAAKEFEEVTKTNPDYAGAYYMMGLSQRSMGKLSQALASLRKAVELEGDNASYKIALAQALLQAQEYGEAYSSLKPLDMSALDASYRSSYALLFAQASTKTNRPDEAIRVLNSQLRADSNNARLFQALGVAYDANGSSADAFRAFKKAYELDSKDAGIAEHGVSAGIQAARESRSDSEKSRLYTESGQLAEKLVASSPTFDNHLLAGEAWLGAKQYSKALDFFDRAKGQQPQNALVHFYRAQCNTSKGNLDAAVGDLQTVLRIGVSGKLRKQVYNQGGYVFEKKGDYDEAKKWYVEADNTSKAQEMDTKRELAAQNVAHRKECDDFRRRIEALKLQIEEFDKLGAAEEASQLREQLPGLERQYAETCS